jgi:hypothetical protein
MSMRDTSASGYVIPASRFTNLLPENLREQYTKAIEDQDVNLVQEILGENAPENFPSFNDAFVHGHEDHGENMVHGEVYISFEEEDLYKPKELNHAGEFLQAQGLLPTFERWTMWG